MYIFFKRMSQRWGIDVWRSGMRENFHSALLYFNNFKPLEQAT